MRIKGKCFKGCVLKGMLERVCIIGFECFQGCVLKGMLYRESIKGNALKGVY